MAKIISCKVCGKNISNNAPICLGCGHNHEQDRKNRIQLIEGLFGAFVVLVVVVIALYFFANQRKFNSAEMREQKPQPQVSTQSNSAQNSQVKRR